MNRLALGTAQFGLPYGIANQAGQVTRQQAKAMLTLASTNGIDTLDTAIAYGDSEACLGAVGTDGFKLVTKLPALPDGCLEVSAWVRQQVAASMLRLGVSAVYGLLLHRPDQLLGPSGAALYQALQVLKDNGQVQKVGISIYSPSELRALMPQYHFDLVQAPFNLLDRRLYSTGWMQRLHDAGVEVHTRSAFLQGLLLMALGDIPAKFAPWSDLWHRWHRWLADRNVSAVQACLAFPLSFPEIDRLVVGADSPSQLAQIMNAANWQPTSDLPDFQCEDENLINPAHWTTL
ncbi:aldo/keto reductase [Propionivibrio sp.]|uniref:aldo/keto reductase n=1 Tax=Propionivibrio sp. TaxID=2212460 RepID=UPI003BF2E2C2